MVAAQRVTARLRIRGGSPSTIAPRIGAFDVGETVYPEAQVVGEPVAGNATWFRLPEERYVWGGGCSPLGVGGQSTSSSLNVPRRADGTIGPLSVAEIETKFGKFDFTNVPDGSIKIDKDWVATNLTDINSPLLSKTGFNKVTVHKKAADAFTRVFDAIAQSGFQDVVRTCAGTWVARHKGWDPNRSLSSHSWGIAIDLNARWNAYGQTPTPLGAIGSVRELIGLFEREGFTWGGYFRPQIITDGMHFEFAVRD